MEDTTTMKVGEPERSRTSWERLFRWLRTRLALLIAPWIGQELASQRMGMGQLEEQLEKALIDATTGANSRAAYDRFIQTKRAHDLHWIAIDLDSFKELNDSYGHDVGDRMLSYVGSCIRVALEAAGLKVRECFWRTGGDELQICHGDQKVVEGLELALKALINFQPLPREFDDLPRPSVSIGSGSSPKAADEAMYAVKSERSSR